MPDRFELPPLGYAFNALEPMVSAELLELHYAAHHRGYVDGANRACRQLAEMRARGDFGHINQLERDLAFHVSGHVLHSILWRNLAPNDGAPPGGRLEASICAAFGSLDMLRRQFLAAGSSLQGSGWVVLSWELAEGGLLVQQIHDHQNNCGTATLPLLVMDLWEHAYYLQYSNRRELWIAMFWDLINWHDVARRLENAVCADLALDLLPRPDRHSVVTPFRRN